LFTANIPHKITREVIAKHSLIRKNKNMKTNREVLGIDVSKDSFYVCLGSMENLRFKIVNQSSFTNDYKGFKEFAAWAGKKLTAKGEHYVMEATGVYYEELAYFLAGRGKQLSVLLPNKSKHFAKSLDIKTKTDKVDAAMLCRIGLERSLPEWKLPSPLMREIKLLSREYKTLKAEAVRVKVRLHVYQYSHQPPAAIMKRLKRRLSFLNKQIAEVEAEIRELVKNDAVLAEKVERIEKIRGLGLMTIITVIAETNGFATIQNAKQLTSYVGLDVVMNQSGKHFGRTRISKKGNRYIRAALYLPAMSAVRYNQRLKQFYTRIMQNHSSGTIGMVAVARKLLILIYAIWKNNTEYDPTLNLAKT
jgi:transposase